MNALLLFALLAAPKAAPAVPDTPAARDHAEAYYHFSLGLQSRFAGDAQDALAEYRRAQKLDPASGEIRSEIAKLLLESGKFDEALPEAEAGVRLNPQDPEAHMTLARLRQMQAEVSSSADSLRRAAAEYEEVVKLRPGDFMTLRILADAYRRLGDNQNAVATWLHYLELDPGSFDAYVQLGSHYLALGDSDKAAAALQKAIEIEPNSGRAEKQLGDIYAQAEQTEQAVLHYRKALELEPADMESHLSLGEVLYRAQRSQEALTEAQVVLGADPKNHYGLNLKGRSLRELKDYGGASAAADAILAQDPRNLDALFLKVTIAESKHDYGTAATLLETLMTRDRPRQDAADAGRKDRLLLVHLGFAYQQLERYADAAEAFGRAKLVGGDPDASLFGYRVEALYLAKDYEKALSEARAARVRFAEDPDLATLEANVLRAKGDSAGALAIVQKLRAKSPSDLNVLLQVAEFYQRAKRYADAEEALQAARKLDTRNLRGLFQLGATLERQKKFDEAEATFREALNVEPDSGPILNYLGYMNADRGVRVEEALGLIEKAVALEPENGAYLDSLGWAQFRLNRLDLAEDNLRKAIARPGANAVVFDHLGDALDRRGNAVEAVDFWKKALGADDEDGELDRANVERKIREAKVAQGVQNQTP